MIFWIASYPKSGNTWIRALISTYLYTDGKEFNFDLLLNIPKFTQEKYISPLIKLEKIKKNPLEITKHWENAQSRINLDNKLKFFKTHNACASYKDRWFTTSNNTLGYIYIVRDPRAVACSLASHSKISIEQSVYNLLNENQIGYNETNKLAELLGSWKINYLSWEKKKSFDGNIVKYEYLIDDKGKELKKILIFLKNKINNFDYVDSPSISINEEKILKTVNSCKFTNMSKMEEVVGFEEAITNKFFRKGTKDSWKSELSQDMRKKIEENFENEMLELGYL